MSFNRLAALEAVTDPTFQTFSLDPQDFRRLVRNEPKGQIGELRGWTRDRGKVIGMGFVASGNADLVITDLDGGTSTASLASRHTPTQ